MKAKELGEECPIVFRAPQSSAAFVVWSMPLYQFPYVTFDPPNAANRAYRPILSLQIVKGALRLPFFGLVDSGADFCDFPISVAHTLGLNPLNHAPSATFGAGSGGPAQTYHFDGVPNLDGYCALA